LRKQKTPLLRTRERKDLLAVMFLAASTAELPRAVLTIEHVFNLKPMAGAEVVGARSTPLVDLAGTPRVEVRLGTAFRRGLTPSP
jgi:hypothetical protein